MGHDGQVSGEVQEALYGLPLGRRADQHLVGDAGQLDDRRAEPAFRVYEGGISVQDLIALHACRADLDQSVALRGKAGSLHVQSDELPVQGCVRVSEDAGAEAALALMREGQIDVVDEIALAAVQDLDGLVGSGYNGFGIGQGVGEGMGHAVVGDRNRPVAPGGGLTDRLGGIGQGVHRGHLGVQMELHALFRRGIPAGRSLCKLDGEGLEIQLVVVLVDRDLAVDTQPGARLVLLRVRLVDGLQDRPGLALLHILVDADGAGVVGHIEAHHPGLGLGQLLVVDGEDLALHADLEHIHVQLRHGDWLLVDGLAEDQALGAGLGWAGSAARGLPPWSSGAGACSLASSRMRLVSAKSSSALSSFPAVELDADGSAEAVGKPLLRPGQMGLQLRKTVAPEMGVEDGALRLPAAARQGGRGRGIEARKQTGDVGEVHCPSRGRS